MSATATASRLKAHAPGSALDRARFLREILQAETLFRHGAVDSIEGAITVLSVKFVS
jgi:hypothetical protein